MLVLLGLSAGAAATPLPWAGTQSSFLLEVGLLAPGDIGVVVPSIGAGAPPKERLRVKTTAATFTLSESRTSLTTGAELLPAVGSSAHVADAMASVRATEYPPENDRTATAAATRLLRVRATHATAAEALQSGPYFGRAIARSDIDWAVELAPIASASGTWPTATADSPILAFDWDFDLLGLATQSFNAIGSVRHSISVEQRVGDHTRRDRVEFGIQMLNGKLAVRSSATKPFEGAGWLAANLATDGVLLGLWDEPAAPLRAGIPLLPVTGPDDTLNIEVRIEHRESSQEVPPFATVQWGSALGTVVLKDGEQAPKVRWDPATGRLTIDPIPAAQLWDAAGDALAGPEMQEDPVSGGSIEIDPLGYLGMSAGLHYFAGDQFRLKDAGGRLLLAAELPTLVYDPSLEDLHGFTFFAPIMSVIDADVTASSWLNAFLSQIDFTTPGMPALFFGTPSAAPLNWSERFTRGVTGLLSLAGAGAGAGPDGGIRSAVSLPASSLLMVLGWALLLQRRHRWLQKPRSRAAIETAPGSSLGRTRDLD